MKTATAKEIRNRASAMLENVIKGNEAVNKSVVFQACCLLL